MVQHPSGEVANECDQDVISVWYNTVLARGVRVIRCELSGTAPVR